MADLSATHREGGHAGATNPRCPLCNPRWKAGATTTPEIAEAIRVGGLDEAWNEAESAWKALGPGEGSALILARYPGRQSEIAYEADLFTFGIGIVKSAATPAAALRLVAVEARAVVRARTDDWPQPVPQMDWESIVGVHPYRAMPDGTPCWCESQGEPHVGWVHAPFCLDKRVVAWLALRSGSPAEVEERCSWCGGEGYVECDDPLQCMSRHLYGQCPCSACGGSGLAKDQTLW